MVGRIFDPIGLVVLLVLAVAGVLLALAVARTRTPPENAVGRCIEAGVLAVLGGLMARIFIAALLAAADDAPGAGLAIGWGFFFVPGLVDTFSFMAGNGPVLTAPDALLMFATVVGGLAGMMNGIWQIYDWTGLGWLAFPLDVTWALAGNTVGCLLHLVNFAWGDHSDETRENAHRYAKGFGLRYNPRFAFTQGAVMSNLDVGIAPAASNGLYRHERTHVWQNRIFGPMYTLTYVGWMLVWLIPAIIAGIVKKGIGGLFAGPNNWCYFNNPWETWAYKVQNVERTNISGVDADDAKMIWPAKYVIAWAIPFFLVTTALAAFATTEAFSGDGAPAVAAAKQKASKGAAAAKPHPKTASASR